MTIKQEIPDAFDDIADGTIIVLDDLMTSAYTKPVCELFTKGSHHRNLSIILITQNIFHQGKYCRDISLNCKYLVLFKNPRDKSQILPLARQVFPDNPSSFVRIYKDATRKPFGYLFLDLTQTANDLLRFQTDIFNKNFNTVYSPKYLLNELQKDESFEKTQTYFTCFKNQ